MKPYTYNGVTGYSKQQALSIIGCSQLATIRRMIKQGRITVVGEMPIPHMPHVMRKLLSIESVELCAENYFPRTHGTHMYQVRLSRIQLKSIQTNFPNLQFTDLTESRRVKREKGDQDDNHRYR